MTCNHARCPDPATVRCRMGTGYFRHSGTTRRQTYVRYCDQHFQTVATMFVLCDIACEDRPNGPSRLVLPGRHPELVARPSL